MNSNEGTSALVNRGETTISSGNGTGFPHLESAPHADSIASRYLKVVEKADSDIAGLQAALNERQMALQQKSNEALYERHRRMSAEAERNRLATKLAQAQRMSDLETSFFQTDGLMLEQLLARHTFLGSLSEKLRQGSNRKAHAKILKLSGLFDADFYAAHYDGQSLQKYIEAGWRRRQQPHPLFDSSFFMHGGAEEPKLDPIIKFLLHKGNEQRSPHPLFDISYYLKQIPNNRFARRFPLTHYLLIGGFCGLDPHPLFDSDFYLHKNPDVAKGAVNPLSHYVSHGAKEGRAPHACFDPAFFRSLCSQEFENPLLHYLAQNEKAEPNPFFSSPYYLRTNPDVALSGVLPFVHYIYSGEAEGRNPHPFFSPAFYVESNPDIVAAGLGSLGHFLEYGQHEGRIAYPRFDKLFYTTFKHGTDRAEQLPYTHYLEIYGGVQSQISKVVNPALLRDLAEALRSNSSLTVAEPVASVIIASTADFPSTIRCLQSLAQQNSSSPFEIILVLASKNPEFVTSLGMLPKIQVVDMPSLENTAKLWNRGAEIASGKHLIFLDDGCEVLPGWLDGLQDSAEHDASLGMIGSKLLCPTGELLQAGGSVSEDCELHSLGYHEDANHPDFCFSKDSEFFVSSFLVPRDTYQQFGPFEECYHQTESISADFACRIRKRKQRVLFQPASISVRLDIETWNETGSEETELKRKQDCIKLQQVRNASQFGTSSSSAIISGRSGKVLVVDATTPTPDRDGGSVITEYWLKALRDKGFEVTFAPQDLTRIPGYSSNLEHAGIRCMMTPYANSLEEVIRQNPGDLRLAVIFRYGVGQKTIALLRQYQPQAKIIFHNVDLHYLRIQRQAVVEGDILKEAQATKVQAEELAIHAAADLVHTLSEIEVLELRKHLPSSWIELSPPIQDCSRSSVPFDARQGICFVGGFRHQPNIDAALYLVNEIMPYVRQQNPSIKLIIVGPDAPEQIRNSACDDIEIRGYVKDLHQLLESVRLTVAPIRFGAGIKTKVSASMAAGVPTVATPAAVEGMDLLPGKHFLLGTTAEEFAAQVCRLYSDPTLWKELSNSSLELALKRYSFDHFSELLDRHLKVLLSE